MVHEIFGNPIKGYGQEYYSSILEEMARNNKYYENIKAQEAQKIKEPNRKNIYYKIQKNNNGKNK